MLTRISDPNISFNFGWIEFYQGAKQLENNAISFIFHINISDFGTFNIFYQYNDLIQELYLTKAVSGEYNNEYLVYVLTINFEQIESISYNAQLPGEVASHKGITVSTIAAKPHNLSLIYKIDGYEFNLDIFIPLFYDEDRETLKNFTNKVQMSSADKKRLMLNRLLKLNNILTIEALYKKINDAENVRSTKKLIENALNADLEGIVAVEANNKGILLKFLQKCNSNVIKMESRFDFKNKCESLKSEFAGELSNDKEIANYMKKAPADIHFFEGLFDYHKTKLITKPNKPQKVSSEFDSEINKIIALDKIIIINEVCQLFLLEGENINKTRILLDGIEKEKDEKLVKTLSRFFESKVNWISGLENICKQEKLKIYKESLKMGKMAVKKIKACVLSDVEKLVQMKAEKIDKLLKR
jgi:hypothetical protein